MEWMGMKYKRKIERNMKEKTELREKKREKREQIFIKE